MRKSIVFVLLFIVMLQVSAFSQSSSDVTAVPGFLFTDFNLGEVKLKSGVVEKVPLNFHVPDQAFMYKADGKYFTITNPEDIDSILLNNEVFVPLNGKFFTVIDKTPVALLMTYDAKVTRMVSTSDHVSTGKKDQSTVYNTVSDVYTMKKFQHNKNFTFVSHFWLKNGNNVYRADNEKQVAKVFPKKQSEILAFVKENKTDFKNLDDVIKLIRFCNQ